jgi:hypothetical protein
MVYNQINTIFVQVTKTASNSIHNLLANEIQLSVPLVHKPYRMSVRDESLYGRDVSNYYNFSVVRNPYDRYVSSYTFTTSIDYWELTFDETLDFLINAAPNWWDNCPSVMRPQWWYLCDPDTYAIEVDEIYKFETINSDWSTIANKINTANPGANISTSLPTLNTTPDRDSWETYYTGSLGQERAQKVELLYAKDFEVFNYDKLVF